MLYCQIVREPEDAPALFVPNKEFRPLRRATRQPFEKGSWARPNFKGMGYGTWNARGGVVVPPLAFHTCCSRVATQIQRLAALRPIGLPGCRLWGARGGPAGAGCSSATADRHLPAAQLKSAPGPSQSPKDAVACYCVLASIAFG